MMQASQQRLVRLNALAGLGGTEDNPATRGWTVFAADGSAVGKVTDLVLDTRTFRVRYLDVTLADDIAQEIAHQPNILVPVGDARMQPGRKVCLENLDRAQVAELPAYLRMPPAPEYETALRRRFDPGFSGTALDRDFFESELYDQDRFLPPREPAPAQ
ncbi:MAG: PRC-barrel domain-containing protein [Gemmatimonadetes bacterium]|nr:PRC-barrel domain-containing protein [Gemmatimonadota bacterium]